MTPQRRLILSAVRADPYHPTADDVYHRVKQDLPRISLGTVYRNLEALCDIGHIQKLEFTGSQKRFDGKTRNHYHIRCTCCGCVVDAPIDLIRDIERRIQGRTGFTIITHRLEFLGVCSDCSRHPMAPGLGRLGDLTSQHRKTR
jgi:Fur family ferric uptake transcriptional regulator